MHPQCTIIYAGDISFVLGSKTEKTLKRHFWAFKGLFSPFFLLFLYVLKGIGCMPPLIKQTPYSHSATKFFLGSSSRVRSGLSKSVACSLC